MMPFPNALLIFSAGSLGGARKRPGSIAPPIDTRSRLLRKNCLELFLFQLLPPLKSALRTSWVHLAAFADVCGVLLTFSPVKKRRLTKTHDLCGGYRAK